jgi:hypothetical protein
MPILKRRTRIVSFRLSQKEYEALRDTCVAHGARSLSDFARSAACRLIDNGSGSPDVTLDNKIRTLQDRVDELDRQVKQLTHLFEFSATPVPSSVNNSLAKRKDG